MRQVILICCNTEFLLDNPYHLNYSLSKSSSFIWCAQVGDAVGGLFIRLANQVIVLPQSWQTDRLKRLIPVRRWFPSVTKALFWMMCQNEKLKSK